MADFKESTAAGLQITRAAVEANDVIRKAEFDAEMAKRPTTATMAIAIAANKHDAVTVSDSASIDLTRTGQLLRADLRRVANSEYQAAGGPTTANFSPVAIGDLLDLGKLSVTVTAVDKYDSEDALVATGVENVDYTVDTVNGKIYIPVGSSLTAVEGASYIKASYSYAQVNDTCGLQETATGIRVAFGTAYGTAARGNHTHANDHVAASGVNSNSANVTVQGQQITVDVNVNPETLEVGAGGVTVKADTFADYVHTHDDATSGASGFMSAADKTKLDGLTGTGALYQDTDTVAITSGSYVSADIRLGAGLASDTNGVKVDFTQVSEINHTHSNVSALASGLMSSGSYTRLQSANYTYLGWADSVSSSVPVNFSLTRDANKHALAILVTTDPIESPSADNFTGLWFSITPL